MKARLITNPGWYARTIEEGGKITDLDIIDSMNNYCHRVMATMELMLSIDEEVVPSKSVGYVAWMVRDMTDEVKALLDLWWEENKENGARRDHTVEVEAIK